MGPRQLWGMGRITRGPAEGEVVSPAGAGGDGVGVGGAAAAAGARERGRNGWLTLRDPGGRGSMT